MPTCPECGAALPAGTAFERGGQWGLPDRRTLDCPYCGAPLEPIGWRQWLLIVVVFATLIAARRLLAPLLEPLLDWRILAVVCLFVVAHVIREIRRWRAHRRESISAAHMPENRDE